MAEQLCDDSKLQTLHSSLWDAIKLLRELHKQFFKIERFYSRKILNERTKNRMTLISILSNLVSR